MLTKYQSKPYSIKEILHVPEEYQQSTLSITQRITLHYYYLFHYFYDLHSYDNVIFLEDDLSVSPDFLNYFETLYPVLISDPSLWCISAWNDNAYTLLLGLEHIDCPTIKRAPIMLFISNELLSFLD